MRLFCDSLVLTVPEFSTQLTMLYVVTSLVTNEHELLEKRSTAPVFGAKRSEAVFLVALFVDHSRGP